MGNVGTSAYLDPVGYVNPSDNGEPVGSVNPSANMDPVGNRDSVNISNEFCFTFSKNFVFHYPWSTESLERRLIQL